MKTLALLALLGSLGGTPENFRESARLAPIASAVSGKPVYVRCATSDAAWAAMLKPWDLPPTQVGGLTFPDNEGSYFAPRVCRDLEGWLRGKSAPTLARLGSVALLLVHEAMHTRGIDPEGEADCAALKALPRVLRQWFGIKRAVVLRAVMNAAWARHRTTPAYQGVC